MAVLDFAGTSATVRPGIALTALSDELWRVTRSTGEVLGYIEILGEGFDRRFGAKRLASGQRRSLPLGEFWKADDAIDCFRL